MQTLNRTVVAAGRIYPKGTARSDADGVPDGAWWDGEPDAPRSSTRKAATRKGGGQDKADGGGDADGS